MAPVLGVAEVHKEFPTRHSRQSRDRLMPSHYMRRIAHYENSSHADVVVCCFATSRVLRGNQLEKCGWWTNNDKHSHRRGLNGSTELLACECLSVTAG